MRTLLIYSALCNELEKVITEQVDYSINNGFIDYSKDYSISTYIADIAPTRIRLSGEKYEGHTATLQFIFQSGIDTDSVITTRSIIQDVEDYLIQLQNQFMRTTNEFEILPNGKIHRVKTEEDRQVTDAYGVNLFVSNTSLVTSTITLGKSENGRQLFSINAAIAYYITGNHTAETQVDTKEPADNSDDNNSKQEE